MAKTRKCALCGAKVAQNVAAHSCPHDVPCRYRLDEHDRVVDWETPHCTECAKAATRPGLALTSKAIDLLAPKASADVS